MNGVINFLKPPGMSSNGAVVFLRGVTGIRKTGHAGTLDPGACGVLPVCVGKATRISAFMMGGQKEYIAEVTFGAATDTGDSYGQVIAVSDAAFPDEKAVRDALSQFSGQITQMTPAYSAAKQDGKKRYQLARRGIELKPQQREIEIFETEYLSRTGEDSHRLRIVCGKGTYIRTLCEDLGKYLGTLAYMSFLVRSKCAGLNIENAYTADELKEMSDIESILVPMDRFLTKLPRIDIAEDFRRALFCGGIIAYHGEPCESACVYVAGCLLGIGCAQDGLLKISTLLVNE